MFSKDRRLIPNLKSPRPYHNGAYEQTEMQDLLPVRHTDAEMNTSHSSVDQTKAAQQPRKSWRRRFSGYRGGILVSISISTFVLILNLVLFLLAKLSWTPDRVNPSIITAMRGDCHKAHSLTIFLHLVINLLGSLLLGASNYTMQRLVAPSRREVDRAHAKRKWLDIGVPSVRNLTSISRTRAFMWLLLALSSVPLHFVYNSVVFETIAANNIDFFIVSPEFFTTKDSWHLAGDTSFMNNLTSPQYIKDLQALVLDGKYQDPSLFRNLSAQECQKHYTKPFITEVGHGFAVPNEESRKIHGPNADNSLLLAQSASGEIKADYPSMEYCLSQKIQQKCELQFSLTILYIIMTANIIKIALMMAVLWGLSDHGTLVTIGDAIQSFLEMPDPSTEGCCLLARDNIGQQWKDGSTPQPLHWQPPKREPFYLACSRRRWIYSIVTYVSGLIVAGALFGVINKDSRTRGRNGFGKLSVNHIVDVYMPFRNAIIPYVLLANLPQAFISFAYITYNGLFTTMLAHREFATYAQKRASLRVTTPRLGQRSTRFLSLPSAWAFPLLLSGVILHWLCSQSLFFARFAVYKNGKQVLTHNDRLLNYKHLQKQDLVFSGIGFSDIALSTAIGWATCLILGCLSISYIFTYPKGLPMGGTNSAVISAACHLPKNNDSRDSEEEESVANKPLMWGVTIPSKTTGVGHCNFSADEVGFPNHGDLYAGFSEKE